MGEAYECGLIKPALQHIRVVDGYTVKGDALLISCVSVFLAWLYRILSPFL